MTTTPCIFFIGQSEATAFRVSVTPKARTGCISQKDYLIRFLNLPSVSVCQTKKPQRNLLVIVQVITRQAAVGEVRRIQELLKLVSAFICSTALLKVGI